MLKYKWSFVVSIIHAIESVQGPDSVPHGHDLKVEFSIVAEREWGISYRDLPRLSSSLVKELDHADLNKVLTFEPLLENIARWAFEALEHQLKEAGLEANGFKVHGVTVSTGNPLDPVVKYCG